MNISLIFLVKNSKIGIFLKKKQKTEMCTQFNFLPLVKITNTKHKLTRVFLKKSITSLRYSKLIGRKLKNNLYFFLNTFVLNFLEIFLKNKIIFNLKKGSNKLTLKQMSFRKFSTKYFKKNLKVSKQIIGVIYYSFHLKDTTIFVNFFKNTIEKLNIKLHKKLFLGLRKIIKDFFKPIFNYLGVFGVFFNIKGKIGVSGSAKKRRYYFYFGKHSITANSIKMDLKFCPIWTFTGSLGFNFLIFF